MFKSSSELIAERQFHTLLICKNCVAKRDDPDLDDCPTQIVYLPLTGAGSACPGGVFTDILCCVHVYVMFDHEQIE